LLEWGLLRAPTNGGSTILAQLRQVEKQTRKTPERLRQYREEQAPPHLKYLLDYWNDFYNGQPFSYIELQAWLTLSKLELEPWEIEIIRQLSLEKDAINTKAQIEAIKNRSQNKRGK